VARTGRKAATVWYRRPVGTLVRLRISFADRPGALARVATVISEHDGNIVSVDVHHAEGTDVVDDLVVSFHREPDLDRLRRDLGREAAATVLSHEETRAEDAIVGSLRRVAELLDAAPEEGADSLVRAVAGLCASPVVWVSPADEAIAFEAGRFAIEHSAAMAVRTTQLPAPLAERLSGEVSLLAVPDQEGPGAGRVVFVARSVSDPFTATEISRIEALIAVHGRAERLVASRHEGGSVARSSG